MIFVCFVHGDQMSFTYCALLNTMMHIHKAGAISNKQTYQVKHLLKVNNLSGGATISYATIATKAELWFQLWHCADFEAEV